MNGRRRVWEKADRRIPDPGAMIDAPEDFAPSKWKTPAEQEANALRRETVRKLRARLSLLSRYARVFHRRISDLDAKAASGMPLSPSDQQGLSYYNDMRDEIIALLQKIDENGG